MVAAAVAAAAWHGDGGGGSHAAVRKESSPLQLAESITRVRSGRAALLFSFRILLGGINRELESSHVQCYLLTKSGPTTLAHSLVGKQAVCSSTAYPHYCP